MKCYNCLWRNVEIELPPNHTYVLIAKYDARPKVKMHFIYVGLRINEEWFAGDFEGKIDGKYGKVTHWMPLPEKPM